MLRNGLPATPNLLASTSNVPPTPSTETHFFEVAVEYTRMTGGLSVYNGSFLAADARGAEEQARTFVQKYLRPQGITNVIAKAQ